MKYKTIEAAWETFSGGCMRPGRPPSAVANARTAFFAGATVMLSMMSDIAANVPEDEAQAVLSRWHDEIKRFTDRLSEGWADR